MLSDKMIYKKITDFFLAELERHGNAKWAIDTIDYLIFNKHASEFYQLSESEQWEVRQVLNALRKVHY